MSLIRKNIQDINYGLHSVNGYQIFNVSNILPYLDQQGIVYLIKLTYSNGLQRIMGAGVSSIQEFN